MNKSFLTEFSLCAFSITNQQNEAVERTLEIAAKTLYIKKIKIKKTFQVFSIIRKKQNYLLMDHFKLEISVQRGLNV